ncbi:MAG: aldehyde ferredoxin oxidoreductase family protein [Firmicutes bacterium]|nr:aldehyde ferredoxin oxidoreductase family protein [Bacillota bacterium]
MAKKLGAYTGKVIKINLTDKTIADYPFSEKQRELFLGGKIMASKIFYDNLFEKIDAYDENNMVVISTSPLNGMPAPSSSRFNISAVSPLTGLLTSSNCGGDFGINLKKAGYDAVIITGKAEEKTLLQITDEGVEFKNADSLWGLHTSEVQTKIGGRCGKLVIGPAGEKLVRYACIINEERAAGRGGLGAVFGSKNLKAVTASGKKGPEAYDKEKLQEFNKKWVKALKDHPLTGKQLPQLGTAGLLTAMQMKHMLATKNFAKGQYEDYEKLSGDYLAENFHRKDAKGKSCKSCPIQCARAVELNGKLIKGPEVEIIGLLGAGILNNDLEKIIRWNYEMDELGMDTISASGVISFAMELNEKGLWDSGLKFGETDNVLDAIIEMGERSTERGNELAEGVKRMSEKFGGKDFAPHSKGLELSAYEPRSAVGQGLGYAVANRGGCHLNAGYLVFAEGLGLSANPRTPKGKASLTTLFQNIMEAVSAGGNCLFTVYCFVPGFMIKKPNSFITRTVNKLAPYLGGVLYFAGKKPELLALNLSAMLPHAIACKHATGSKLNMGKFIRIGERGYNMERIVNIRLGLKAEDDTLPKRLTHELQDASDKKSFVPLEFMKKRYYLMRGWGKDGVPPKKLIKKLKLDTTV